MVSYLQKLNVGTLQKMVQYDLILTEAKRQRLTEDGRILKISNIYPLI